MYSWVHRPTTFGQSGTNNDLLSKKDFTAKARRTQREIRMLIDKKILCVFFAAFATLR